MQKIVNRNYTTGFLGDIVRDGPYRAKPGRITDIAAGVDPSTTNRISRAFGYAGDMPDLGLTHAADVYEVTVGGPVFFGVLGHPKHYALYGGLSGPLSPTLDLLSGMNAEFFDMVTGMVAEVFNETTAAKNVTFGDSLAYVSAAATAAQNPLGLPAGAIVSVPAGQNAAPGFIAIPNSRISNSFSLIASAAGAAISGDAIIQLTQ